MISQRDLPARIFSIRWETLLSTWTNQFYFDVSQSNMEVGWARLFSMLEFEVRGKWEEAGDLWRKAGEAQEGWNRGEE